MTETDDVQAPCTGSVLVSIPKSGTHLSLRLYGRAGYMKAGWGQIEAEDRPLPPEALKKNLLQSPSVAAIARKFPFLTPDVIFDLLAYHARSEIGDTRWPLEWDIPAELQGAWSEVRQLSGDGLFVPGFVAVTHVLPWETVSWRLLSAWGKTGVPAIVYGYRDPRAQIVSMVKFLADDPQMTGNPMMRVYRPILKELGSMDRMLSFAITDPSFPFREAYRQNRWMLYHPHVLKQRFEDMVGEEGGGSREAQAAAIESWAKFLRVDIPPETLADGLFGNTKTFHKGRVDAWRDVFKAHHLEAFEREFGDVLEDYGYADA
jgi:hypothetical protein